MSKIRLLDMKILSLLIAIALGSPAFAQTSGADKCHTYVASSEMRLACYDKQTGFAGAPDPKIVKQETGPQDEKPADTGSWQVSSSVSDLDDSTNVCLRLASDEDISGRFNGAGPMVLNLHCRENKTMLYIYFNGLHMSDYQYGTVTYRLDAEKAQKKKMQESTDHSALGLWSGSGAIPFTKAMFGHDKLLIQATPYSENAVTAIFSISELEEAIKPLRASCNW